MSTATRGASSAVMFSGVAGSPRRLLLDASRAVRATSLTGGDAEVSVRAALRHRDVVTSDRCAVLPRYIECGALTQRCGRRVLLQDGSVDMDRRRMSGAMAVRTRMPTRTSGADLPRSQRWLSS